VPNLSPREHIQSHLCPVHKLYVLDSTRRRASSQFEASAATHVSSPRMPVTEMFHESRRSTRVPLKVVITVEGGAEIQTCDGETIVVSLHGALIATSVELSRGMKISIHVYVTDKRAAARVVYVDPRSPLHCGIELDQPRNIWGVPLPPDDWERRQP